MKAVLHQQSRILWVHKRKFLCAVTSCLFLLTSMLLTCNCWSFSPGLALQSSYHFFSQTWACSHQQQSVMSSYSCTYSLCVSRWNVRPIVRFWFIYCMWCGCKQLPVGADL